MPRRSLISALAVAAVALAAAPAAAAPESTGIQRVAVVRLGFGGGVHESGRDLFAQRLVEGLAAARFEVLAGPAVVRKLRDGGERCEDASCYPQVARALGVSYLVSGRVGEQSKTYLIALELINGRTGEVIGSVRERCETCGIEEAGEKMDLAASALRARLEAVARTPARFVIRSRPAAARAYIDDKEVGRTPIDMEIAAGEHRLQLELPGHEPLQRSFTVVSGVDESLDFELVRRPTSFPFRIVGWGMLAGGAALIAGGIVALMVDGDEISCADDEKDREMNCPFVRDTDVLGAVLIGAGAVSASLGGVSLYLGSRGIDEGGERASVVGLRWRGRF